MKLSTFIFAIACTFSTALAAPANDAREGVEPLNARQAVCGDFTCSTDTDCYGQRCGNCEGGRCGCPPEGC